MSPGSFIGKGANLQTCRDETRGARQGRASRSKVHKRLGWEDLTPAEEASCNWEMEETGVEGPDSQVSLPSVLLMIAARYCGVVVLLREFRHI